jgi:hypothetical protein
MTAVDSSANESGQSGIRMEEAPAPKAAVAGPLAGNPSLVTSPRGEMAQDLRPPAAKWAPGVSWHYLTHDRCED